MVMDGPMGISTTMTDIQNDMMILQNWFSPAFPIGAFSYSHGLETAIQEEVVTDRNSLFAWISYLLSHGSGRNDALFIKAAYEGVNGVNELCLALSGCKERYQEVLELGNAFTRIYNSSYDERLAENLSYPVVIGMAAKKKKMNLELTTQSYLQAFATNLISVGIRIIPIGQQAGQDCLIDLYPVIQDVIKKNKFATIDDLGTSTFIADIMAIKHENAVPRIYRT